MGAQPPALSELGKSAEPDIPPSYRYYDEHSLSVSSSLRSGSPSRSQSSLKNTQIQPHVASPTSPASVGLTAPMYSPPRQVFSPTPFKSVIGFAPAQTITPPIPPAAIQQGAWRVEEIESKVTAEKGMAPPSEASPMRELTSSISSLSLSLARSPATIPKSSTTSGVFSTSSPSAWPSVIPAPSSDQSRSLPSAGVQSRSPPLSSQNGVKQSSSDAFPHPKSPEKVPSLIISSPSSAKKAPISTATFSSTLPTLPSPPPTPGTPSPSGSDLALDLFVVAASKRLPIFATLTLSPKKNEPIRA